MPTPAIPAGVLEEMVTDAIGPDLERVAIDSPGFPVESLVKRLAIRLLPVLARLHDADCGRRARYRKPR